MANHILMFPFYAQGHLPVMLHLAELLSNHDIQVTFINNNFYNFPVHTPRSLEYYTGLPNFRFLSLNTPHEELPKSFHELIGQEESRRVNCKDEYRRILIGHRDDDGWPRVTCVVADSFVSLALDVPEELGIPIMLLNIPSAASVWFYYCMPIFLETNDFPFQDGSDYDKEVHGIPGMEGILRRKDLHSFVTEAKCKNDQVLQYMLTTGKNLCRAKALIFNTIEAAELPILSRIRSIFPATYTISPLQKLVDHQLKHDHMIKDDRVDGINNNCLSWLDSKAVKSVVYVSFGSTTRMSKDELLELWHGLVDTGYPFLWVVRKDLLIGSEDNDDSSIEKLEKTELLLDATKKRGCIVAWAPQKEVLVHPSIGCFVTHSGWNSVLESIHAGVPMICWPFLGDHPINCRFVAHVWRIGLDMRGPMQRNVVEKAVKKAMEGDGAREMNRSVALLSKMAQQSVQSGGSSSKDFEALVQQILSFGV